MKEHIFNKNSTDACKGLALILLLWHHLFYMNPEFGFITYKFALLSKVCVAIFVILSGYGFSESVKHKNIGLFSFYQKRLVPLLFNYWFIALIFVPIGILLFDRTLFDAFSSHAYTKFIVQMTGLHRFFYSDYGYNATWWYMSVIIALIILFPFIYDLIKKYGMLILILLLILLFPKNFFSPVINTWLLPFSLGIYLSQNNYIATISNRLNRFGNWRFVMLVGAIIFIAVFRSFSPVLGGIYSDWLFGGILILFIFEVTMVFNRLNLILGYLGKHLFNIFLFHTFIYLYFFSDFIYMFKYPVFIFFVLLFICILVSLVIEQLKVIVGFDKLVKWVSRLKVPAYLEIDFVRKATVDVSK